MHENFNTYYDNIDHSFWRNLCVEEGAICQFSKGEEFISAGEVARYIGYIKSGALKYVAYSADGTEHVVGLEFAGGFVADFPFHCSAKSRAYQLLQSQTVRYSAYRPRMLKHGWRPTNHCATL